ncbi:hypothetical protein Plec18167_006626 [Paecilomyces lecythidis]|uniref:Dimethylallyl tryptophan synthase n=1 Tax=Paecilomyces lecythidis TaxID=3004212 RepID=A0ABR3X966_9EURO
MSFLVAGRSPVTWGSNLRSRFSQKFKLYTSTENHSKKIIPLLPNVPSEIDSRFWDACVGDAFRTLMGGAGYDAATLDANLKFCSQSVAPYLGSRPTRGQPPQWKSFMTDDFSPLEYSWSWDGTPTIRYSFEPIGPLAGTRLDPYNHKAPMQYVDRLRHSLPGADWRWFDHFAREFYQDSTSASRELLASGEGSSASSMFVGFDLTRDGLVCKMYFVPVKAEQTGQSRLTVLEDAVRGLPNYHQLAAYSYLENFLRRQERDMPQQIIGVAVDCIDPSLAKLKVYFRSPTTTFASVIDTLTAGGTISTWNDSALEELRALWSLVFGLPPNFSDDQELPWKSHETSGVLYNFDIKIGNRQPETKVYIPVRHYSHNDRVIAEGLVEFLRRHRGHTQYDDNFLRTLEQLSSFRSLEDGCGLQTYISCSFKKNKLSLTSYLSPQIYHPRRWSQTAS